MSDYSSTIREHFGKVTAKPTGRVRIYLCYTSYSGKKPNNIYGFGHTVFLSCAFLTTFIAQNQCNIAKVTNICDYFNCKK